MDALHWTVVVVVALVTVYAAGHALLNARDPRAALGWIAVSIMFPLAGALLYFVFGVNRVRSYARRLERSSPFKLASGDPAAAGLDHERALQLPPEYTELARISDAVARHPLVAGNRLAALYNGEQAYPAMLEAIESAQRSVYLATYIFETNRTGYRFIDALARAAARGVDVRVILDGFGELYSFPWAGRVLTRRRVRVARFLPPKLFPPTVQVNLRTHRKLLVIDGLTGFTGGMNIGDRHLTADSSRAARVVDMHFRLTGPVVTQMEMTFLEDWYFCTGERADLSPVEPASDGLAVCRAVTDGPDEDMDRLATILVGAISSARTRILVMTPYFVPSREMIGALQSAALRGVEVVVVLPARNNLPFVHWATRNMLWELLQRGVRVYYQPPPFVHTKLFVVDDIYAQIGSANLDPRSLRLNFELVVEIYDRSFAADLAAHVEATRRRSVEVSLAELRARPLPVRVRDACAWLFSPYL